jgi:hypothetical protein
MITESDWPAVSGPARTADSVHIAMVRASGSVWVQINRFGASVACGLGPALAACCARPRATILLAWRRLAVGTKQILSCDPRAR